jgi:hypothetical protein
MDLIKMALG